MNKINNYRLNQIILVEDSLEAITCRGKNKGGWWF